MCIDKVRLDFCYPVSIVQNRTTTQSKKEGKSCIVCNFWSFDFRTYVSIFQEHSKKTKIQVYILPIS